MYYFGTTLSLLYSVNYQISQNTELEQQYETTTTFFVQAAIFTGTIQTGIKQPKARYEYDIWKIE